MSTHLIEPILPSVRGSSFPVLDDLSEVVRRVQSGEAEAQNILYTQLISRFRGLFARRMTRVDVEDSLQNVFVITVNAIRARKVLDPRRLPGFVKTVAVRQALDRFKVLRADRNRQIDLESITPSATDADPEAEYLARERQSIMARELERLSRRDREILIRFYLHEQTKEEICRDLSLSDTQFRLRKSRAKAKLTDAVSAASARRQRSIAAI